MITLVLLMYVFAPLDCRRFIVHTHKKKNAFIVFSTILYTVGLNVHIGSQLSKKLKMSRETWGVKEGQW